MSTSQLPASFTCAASPLTGEFQLILDVGEVRHNKEGGKNEFARALECETDFPPLVIMTYGAVKVYNNCRIT